MGFLSNFRWKSHPDPATADPAGAGGAPAAPPPPPVRCRPARAEEARAAVALVMGEVGRPADDALVDDFLAFAAQRGIDLTHLWLAERAGQLLWALLPVLSPGRTMLLLSPAGGEAPTPGAAAACAEGGGPLVDAVCRHFAGGEHRVQLVQVLLDPADAAGHAMYGSRGFREMAELLYLQANVSAKSPAPPTPPGWTWQTYTPANHGRFAATIVASYQDSLDCPSLNGVRDIEDIITGHKASGVFDPDWWFLLCERAPVIDGGPVQELPRGVLLLSRAARGSGGGMDGAAELVYLGLVPEARGHGLGELAMRLAMHLLAQAGCSRLHLAVDARNVPALKLYHRFGLHSIGSKVAMMKPTGAGEMTGEMTNDANPNDESMTKPE